MASTSPGVRAERISFGDVVSMRAEALERRPLSIHGGFHVRLSNRELALGHINEVRRTCKSRWPQR